MKTALKILSAIIIIGVILGGVGLIIIVSQNDNLSAFFEADDEDYEKFEHTLSGVPLGLLLEADNRQIKIVKSLDEDTHLTYYASENDIVNYKQINDFLSIEAEDLRKNRWFNFNFRSPSSTVKTITIKIPSTFDGVMDIKTINGSIIVKGMGTIEKADLRSTNGTIELENASLEKNSRLQTTNGTIEIRNLSCYEKLTLQTTNGKISANNIVSSSIEGLATNGHVDMKNIDSSDIKGQSTNGAVDITVLGQKEDYEISVSVTVGSITMNGTSYATGTINPGASKKLSANTTTGAVTINFV